MKIFELAYRYYEDYAPRLFSGPDNVTLGKWKGLCRRLVPIAAEKLMGEATPDTSYIGWDKIVDEVAAMLPAHGFTPVEPISVGFFGPGIIGMNGHVEPAERRLLGKELAAKIAERNDRVFHGAAAAVLASEE